MTSVAPAFIETDMTDQMMEKRADEAGVSVDGGSLMSVDI